MASIIGLLLIGLAAGWLAGHLTRGHDFGLVGNLIVGVIGAALGSVVFRLVGLSASGLLGELISATCGAVLLLYVLQFLKQKRVI